MIGLIKLIPLVLQLISTIVSWAREKELINEGMDKAIAQQSAGILVQTKARNEIYAQVLKENEAQVDSDLENMEPK